MKRVLITGGAGFIGTNLVEYLMAGRDYDLIVLDNETNGDGEAVARLGARFVKGDILDRDLVSEVSRGMNAIVHLAANTRVIDSIDDPEANFRVNVMGTFYLLEAARRNRIERFINASTGGAISGNARPPIHEDLPARPLSPYGASKLAAEGYCSAYAGSYGLSAASLRFSNVYGPRSGFKESVVARFMKHILGGEKLVVYGDGSQTRDFLFVGDLVTGIRSAVESTESGVFQLGSGRPTSLLELIGLLRSSVGPERDFEVEFRAFRAGEVRETWCDIAKARHELGFRPATSLEDGLRRTWRWFQGG
jgi:UDP-glucose 4-epimerase